MTTNVVLPVLYLLAFVVGLPSNLLALRVLLFQPKPLPSTILLINLTAADCLVLLALPFRIVYHFRGNHWELGEPACRAVMAVFYGNMYGSVLCLTLVAVDRYVAVVHPFGAKVLRGRRTSLAMTALVWLAVLAAMLPLLLSRQTYVVEELHITTCHDALPEEEQDSYLLPYFASLFVLGFLLPSLVVLFCHGAVLHTLLLQRQRYSHAVWVTLLVLLVFVLCLLPSNLLLLLTYSVEGDGEELYLPYMLSLALSTYSSCLDPFIFYFVSADFRDKASRALRCHGNRVDNPSKNDVSDPSSSTNSNRLERVA